MKPESHLPAALYAAGHPVLADPGETRTLQHLPQLDGVRAVAVGLVLWYHLLPDRALIRGGPPWGAIGVGLFFTLSGFLITRILLNCRLKMEAGRATLGQTMRQFYARRCLRIFPLYYGVLLAMLVFNPTNFRGRFWWNAAYLTNARFAYWPATRGEPEIERHLWSLSVEEQFYLVWPVLVLLTPRRLLLPLVLLTVAAGPLWRTQTYVPKLLIHEWMMPGCLDLLGGGALLALLSLPQFKWSRWHDAFVQLCGVFGLPLLIAFVAQRMNTTLDSRGRMTATGYQWLRWGGAVYPITALSAVWFVGTAARGFRGPIGRALTWSPLVYLGRISYGLYVLHLFVPHVMTALFPRAFPLGQRLPWHSAALMAISVAVASASWFLFEAPVNRLKRYFEYDAPAPPPALGAAPKPATAAASTPTSA